MNNINFGILGGDLRYKYIYNMLKEEGFKVKCFKNKFIEKNEDSLKDLLKDTDILLAPIPFSKDKKNIFIPEFEELSFELLLNNLKDFNIKLIAGGVIPKSFIEKAENIQILDFFEENSVAISNAIPTAEGAIQTAMLESHKTIFGSNSLILGYGRCGKILANSLKGLNSNVTATYRKEEDNSYMQAFGIKSLPLNKLKENVKNFDFIFNTIPSCVLNKDVLKEINKDTLIIDLAEAPGGVDYNFARELNINAIYCPGLPGRVAPYYAGKILKDELLKCCKKINII